MHVSKWQVSNKCLFLKKNLPYKRPYPSGGGVLRVTLGMRLHHIGHSHICMGLRLTSEDVTSVIPESYKCFTTLVSSSIIDTQLKPGKRSFIEAPIL